MFSLSEQELQDLIDKHNGRSRSKDPVPEYDLKTVVEYGLMFLYGKMHLRDGKVVQCGEKLNLYKKHKCKSPAKKAKTEMSNKFFEISNIKALERTPDTLKTCWTGYNLAILTADFTLQGYFKRDLLFQRKFDMASAMVAGSDKICIGLFSGEIIYFDPITQNEITKACHSDTVTSLRYENSQLLSSSLDGSIFYRKKIQISTSGVLEAHYIADDKFICSCCDNTVVLYDFGDARPFSGHKDRIKSLSYNRFAISTSKSGEVGFLVNEKSLEISNLGASLHRRVSPQQFFGYGLTEVFLYDVNKNERLWTMEDHTLSLALRENTLVYAHNKGLKAFDIRSKESIEVQLNANITDLSFSGSGDMLLVCTDQSPLILDIKAI